MRSAVPESKAPRSMPRLTVTARRRWHASDGFQGFAESLSRCQTAICTRKSDLKLNVKWFHSHNGKYGGVWEEWKNPADGLQWQTTVHGAEHEIERGSIEMTGVKFTQAARNAAGGWKLTAATKRLLEQSRGSQWARYK